MSSSETKIMDGAMGTMLLSRGIPLSSCFEEFNLTRPDLISEIHTSYLEAGAQVIVTNTFGANPSRLKEHHLTKKLAAINQAGVHIAKQAAGKRAKVFASLGPLGKASCTMSSREMNRCFLEQVRVLEAEKPDGYLIETMTNLGEAQAALQAVRSLTKRFTIVLMAPIAVGHVASGGPLRVLSETLRGEGADVTGFNCGTDPQEIHDLMKAFCIADPGPWCVRPSAGLPGNYLAPEEFSKWGRRFQELGMQWLGGCCGTTPGHIRAFVEKLN